MTTYSKKYFNEETQQWEPLYSTEGRSAYETAKLNGYTGTEEEFNKALSQIPVVISSIENYPTEGSKNLITSGGVYQAVKNSETSAEETHQELLNEISNVNTTLSTEISTVNTNLTTKITQVETTTIPNAIKAAIVDNLDTEDSNKALSATQGKILKTMISNLANLRIEVVSELPETGETNVIYLVKKSGTNPDTHDEYVYVEGNWEKIGNTEIDLSNYYTKDQVYSKSETYNQNEVNTLITEIEGNIPTIPNIETSMSGSGNVITSIEVDTTNKHKVNAVKGISVYSKTEVDEKLSGSGLGDVVAESPFSTANNVIISGSAGKTVKDSGILLTNLATKEFVNQFEPEWNKIAHKPETFVPSAHTHTISQITDFPKLGTLASKDKIDESDLNFDIPEGVVVDSELSSTSENAVQNKIITNALSSKVEQSALSNYVTKDEIAELGGGDVVANGDLVDNRIIIGAGTKSVSASNISISDITSVTNTVSEIIDGTTKLDYIDTLYIEGDSGDLMPINRNADTINIKGSDGGMITVHTDNADGKEKVLIGHTSGITHVPEALSESDEDRIPFVPGGMTGYNLGKIGLDIRIPTAAIDGLSNVAKSGDYADLNGSPNALPNPSSLTVIAGTNITVHSGAEAHTIDLNETYTKLLNSVDTPGKAGIFYGDSPSYSVNTVYVTSRNPDAIIVFPPATTVTFGSNYVKMKDLDTLSGGSYKCYCITYITTGLVLVNGAIYG
jgi:hypothetical protein